MNPFTFALIWSVAFAVLDMVCEVLIMMGLVPAVAFMYLYGWPAAIWNEFIWKLEGGSGGGLSFHYSTFGDIISWAVWFVLFLAWGFIRNVEVRTSQSRQPDNPPDNP